MSRYSDPYHSPEYESFVAEMVNHCRCAPSFCPCDGVLAGGICDDLGHQEVLEQFEDDQREEE